MPDITCPGCATVTVLVEVRRDAGSFCPVCDYPLFWARAPLAVGAPAVSTGAGLRRLPGTAGRSTDASFPCPTCREPNQVIGVLCIRCGGELRPAPVIVAPVVPVVPPPVVAVEPPRRRWPLILATVFVLLLLVALTVVLLGQA